MKRRDREAVRVRGSMDRHGRELDGLGWGRSWAFVLVSKRGSEPGICEGRVRYFPAFQRKEKGAAASAVGNRKRIWRILVSIS
jgi:hypothetical protein